MGSSKCLFCGFEGNVRWFPFPSRNRGGMLRDLRLFQQLGVILRFVFAKNENFLLPRPVTHWHAPEGGQRREKSDQMELWCIAITSPDFGLVLKRRWKKTSASICGSWFGQQPPFYLIPKWKQEQRAVLIFGFLLRCGIFVVGLILWHVV